MLRNTEKIEGKKRVLESARKLQNTRKDIINLFEEGIFPYRGNVLKTKKESKENKFFEYIENESEDINYDLFRKYFNFETPTQLGIKNKNKNNDSVEEIKTYGVNEMMRLKKCLKMKKN